MNELVRVAVQQALFDCEVHRSAGGASLIDEPLPLDLIAGILGAGLPFSLRSLAVAPYTPAPSAAERLAEHAGVLTRDGFALCLQDATTLHHEPFAFGLRRGNHVRVLAFVRMYTDQPRRDWNEDLLLANIARLGARYDLRVRSNDSALDEFVQLEDPGAMSEVLFHA